MSIPYGNSGSNHGHLPAPTPEVKYPPTARNGADTRPGAAQMASPVTPTAAPAAVPGFLVAYVVACESVWSDRSIPAILHDEMFLRTAPASFGACFEAEPTAAEAARQAASMVAIIQCCRCYAWVGKG
jgi:hypothetical protein